MRIFKDLMVRIGIAILLCMVYAIVMGVLVFIVTPIVLIFVLGIIVNGVNIKVTANGIKDKLGNLFSGSTNNFTF